MSLLFRSSKRASKVSGPVYDGEIPPRSGVSGRPVSVTGDQALRHSAVWACLRLRANLISTLPLDVYRTVNGQRVELPKPPVLRAPGGEEMPYVDWMYATQFDLDRAGNAFGLITARDGTGLPARIELQSLAEASVRVKDGQLRYRFGREEYAASEVWHERQYPVAGLPVGLSPIAYAAWSIGEYLSIQDFATEWFTGGGVPRAHLKNTGRTLTSDEAQTVKQRFKASVQAGDAFVSGSDWEYSPIQAEQTGMEWLEARKFGIGDIARFLDCPGDLIDAAVTSGNITYANVTQRNLQFLVMSLAPPIVRRETAFTERLLPQPRFVKLNTNALLRMDPKTRAETLLLQINSRTLAPSEARALDDRAPFTASQLAEFDRFWPAAPPMPPGQGGSSDEGSISNVG